MSNPMPGKPLSAAQTNELRANRLSSFAKLAVQVEKEHQYPAELLVTQWAIESGWGTQESGTNNFFGMTRAQRHGNNWKWCPTREVLSEKGILTYLDTEERSRITAKTLRADGLFDVRLYRRFANYATLTEGVLDKVNLIQTGDRYKKFFDVYRVDGNLSKLLSSVLPVYASDPAYLSLVKAIMAQTNVKAAIAAARTEVS